LYKFKALITYNSVEDNRDPSGIISSTSNMIISPPLSLSPFHVENPARGGGEGEMGVR